MHTYIFLCCGGWPRSCFHPVYCTSMNIQEYTTLTLYITLLLVCVFTHEISQLFTAISNNCRPTARLLWSYLPQRMNSMNGVGTDVEKKQPTTPSFTTTNPVFFFCDRMHTFRFFFVPKIGFLSVTAMLFLVGQTRTKATIFFGCDGPPKEVVDKAGDTDVLTFHLFCF